MAQLVHTRICIGSGKERKGCLEERKIWSSVFVDCTCPAASTTTGSVTYGMKSSGRVFGNGANVEAARTGARSKAARDTDSISKNFSQKINQMGNPGGNLKRRKGEAFEKLTLCDCTKAVLNGNFILTMVWAWNKQAR